MFNYGWLLKNKLDYNDIEDCMQVLKYVGVLYFVTDEEHQKNIKVFGEEVVNQFDIIQVKDNLLKQVVQNNYDGNVNDITEMDVFVVYFQVLGTMVDFSKFDDGYFVQFRQDCLGEYYV